MVEYYIWLQQVLGYGSDTARRVIGEYADAKAFYLADDKEKISRCKLSKSQVSRLHNVKRKTIYKIIEDCQQNGIEIITPLSPKYPEKLLNMVDPPLALYVKGNFDFIGKPCISIVGPRKISNYGSRCAYTIANTLASVGFAVVSGGALGGDSAAHLGALEANGFTAAVLGCGIGADYLKQNKELWDRIADKGCLLSEYPPFEKPSKSSFPIRNRIISALADGVVIPEAGEKSGALITAKHALEQGKDIFVIPGSPSAPQYKGSNRLISEGARLLSSINEIVDEYLSLYPNKLHLPSSPVGLPTEESITEKAKPENIESKPSEQKPKADETMLSQSAKEVLALVRSLESEQFVTADDIAEKFSLSAGGVLASFTELEIFGFLELCPGGRYKIV